MSSQKRVLIVDDTMDIARLLRTVLISMDPGLNISVLPSAEEAILESTRVPIDLLVSDIRLPGISGFDLVKKIRARYPGVHVIMVTGLTDSRINPEASALGVEVVLPKPLDMDAFRKAAGRYLELDPAVLGGLPSGASSTARSSGPAPASGAGRESTLDLLQHVRDDLNAACVIWLDAAGHALLCAGVLPPAFEADWGQRLAGMMAAQEKAAFSPAQENVTLGRGAAMDFVLGCRGPMGVIALLKPGSSTTRLLLAAEAVMSVLGQMHAPSAPKPLETVPGAAAAAVTAVRNSAQPVKVTANAVVEKAVAPAPEMKASPEPAAEEEADPGQIQSLLQQMERPALSAEIDNFWEAAVNEVGKSPGGGDSISFEEARRRGLAPDAFN